MATKTNYRARKIPAVKGQTSSAPNGQMRPL